MKISRDIGVDHHSRLDITQLFIVQTSIGFCCFSLKLFDDSQAKAIYDSCQISSPLAFCDSS